MTSPVKRSLEIVLSNNRRLAFTGYVGAELDENLAKIATGKVTATEAKAIERAIYKDGFLSADEHLGALAMAACTQQGDRVKSVAYTDADGTPMALQMRANERAGVGSSLLQCATSATDSDANGIVTRMLEGRMPHQKTLTTELGRGVDAAVARRMRDILTGTKTVEGDPASIGPSAEDYDQYAEEEAEEEAAYHEYDVFGGAVYYGDDSSADDAVDERFWEGAGSGLTVSHDAMVEVLALLRDAPMIGAQTIGGLMNLIRDVRFEKPEDWFSLRATLQQHYDSSNLKGVFPSHRIVSELFRMADAFASSRKSICKEEAAKMLTLAAMQGVPSLDVSRALQIISDRFPFTAAAKAQLQKFIHNIPNGDPKEWTMFVYLAADNDLDSFSIDDVNEMEEKFGKVAEFMNIVVLADGSEQDSGAVPGFNWKTKTRMLLIEQDKNEDGRGIVSKEIAIPGGTDLGKLMRAGRGELNMASGDTLRAAVEFVQKAMPSQNMFLDIWDHGDSWRGVAVDNTADYSDDLLRLREMKDALTDLPQKIDVVGFDACLMQNLSVASAMESTGIDFMVASEELEPGEGWRYEKVLSKLANVRRYHGELTPEKLAENVVTSYEHGETLSAIRLDAMPAIHSQLDSLGAALMKAGARGDETIEESLLNARPFYDEGLVDAVTFTESLQANFDPSSPVYREARKLEKIVRMSVVAERNDELYDGAATGLTFHIPYWEYSQAFDRQSDDWLDTAPSWRAFLRGIDE